MRYTVAWLGGPLRLLLGSGSVDFGVYVLLMTHCKKKKKTVNNQFGVALLMKRRKFNLIAIPDDGLTFGDVIPIPVM
jgi:ABC-type nitrate/sulfonate/bicarbonate transport system substrate-binding protein